MLGNIKVCKGRLVTARRDEGRGDRTAFAKRRQDGRGDKRQHMGYPHVATTLKYLEGKLEIANVEPCDDVVGIGGSGTRGLGYGGSKRRDVANLLFREYSSPAHTAFVKDRCPDMVSFRAFRAIWRQRDVDMRKPYLRLECRGIW